MTYILDAIAALHDHHQEWAADYQYNLQTNEFYYKAGDDFETNKVAEWFEIGMW